jgi:hypothetical protein
MHSIYFRSAVGQHVKLACCEFETRDDVAREQLMLRAHHLRMTEGTYHIQDAHLAAAIERLTKQTQESLSDDREPKHAYAREVDGP